MERERKMKYDREFKLNAIRLYETSGKRQREIEKDLGIGAGCMSHWRKEFEEEEKGAAPGNEVLPDKDKEIARLKRENVILTEERDILKKAVGIFSKQPR